VEELMADYDVEIRTVEPSAPAVGPSDITVRHHLTDRARVTMEMLSGGHLLHLAVAGCLFNDILREARRRGLVVTDLRVSAGGGFGGEPSVSTGITYTVDVAGDAPEAVLRRLVADCEADATIPHVLRVGSDVRSREVLVRGSAGDD
jgi:uncharacterized OsmC-like protein